MPETPLRVLLDQNIPREVLAWLKERKPSWICSHTSEIGMSGAPDPEIFRWAQTNGYIIVTFDEDFADTRTFALGAHFGIVRLRVWPTTAEATCNALSRLTAAVADADLAGSLVIVDQGR